MELKVRAAEVTLWSKRLSAWLALFQAMPEKTLEISRVRRGCIDAAAGCPIPGTIVDGRLLLTLAGSCPLYARGRAARRCRVPGPTRRRAARLGEKTIATLALERALSLDPKDPGVRLELAGALQTAERFEDALRIYETALLEGDARYRRVEVLVALKRFDRACADCEMILRAQPDARPAKRWLADNIQLEGRLRRGDPALHGTGPRQARRCGRFRSGSEVTLWSGDAAKALSLFQRLPEKALEPVHSPQLRRRRCGQRSARPGQDRSQVAARCRSPLTHGQR